MHTHALSLTEYLPAWTLYC